MDLVKSCRDKLAYFRIKELKDVLTQLGLAKQGRKQDLVDRILQLLSDDQAPKSQFWGKRNLMGKESVAKIIDDIYRKLQYPGATDLASKSHYSSNCNNVKLNEEVDSYKLENKIRCLCGSSMLTEAIIQCEDPRCGIWQHITCVIVPEKPLENARPDIPPHFYCEICRINRADPFWVTLEHPLLPMKLTSSAIMSDRTNTVESVEKTFLLSRADREMLQKAEYDLQIWCLLLNDKVPFRMQWPLYADLQVNGVTTRLLNRPGSQSLGTNGRDDGPVITTCSREGINRICLSRCDARIFCFGIRLAKRRTVQQVLSLIPKEAEGEHFEDALARVRRCIGGGDMENADSDSDLEVVSDSVVVNLRCPMSGSRIRIAGRFKPCVHIRCFDLETFVELNQRSRKWQCPICLKNFSLEHIVVDPYINPITSMLLKCGEDVTEIDVKPDGSWRAKNENEFRDLSNWHLPDGSLCPATDAEIKTDLVKLKQIKPEGNKDLKSGIKRNQNGGWEFSKFEDIKFHHGSHVAAKFEDLYQDVMPMDSSSTGSFGKSPTVNQEVRNNFELSLNYGHELDSLSLNTVPTYNVENRTPPPLKDSDVIVLSDSDEENRTLVCPDTIYDTHPPDGNGLHFPGHRGVSERFAEADVGANGLGLFSNNSDDFGLPMWPLQTLPQTEPSFQLFETEANIPDGLINSRGSLGSAPVNSFGLTTHGLDDVQNFSAFHSNTELHGSLVDNPLAFASDDPSLQIFLPSRPGDSLQEDLSDHVEATNEIKIDDWISLRLAGGGGLTEPASMNGQGSTQQFPSNKSPSDPLDESASLLLSINDTRNNVSSNNRPVVISCSKCYPFTLTRIKITESNFLRPQTQVLEIFQGVLWCSWNFCLLTDRIWFNGRAEACPRCKPNWLACVL